MQHSDPAWLASSRIRSRKSEHHKYNKLSTQNWQITRRDWAWQIWTIQEYGKANLIKKVSSRGDRPAIYLKYHLITKTNCRQKLRLKKSKVEADTASPGTSRNTTSDFRWTSPWLCKSRLCHQSRKTMKTKRISIWMNTILKMKIWLTSVLAQAREIRPKSTDIRMIARSQRSLRRWRRKRMRKSSSTNIFRSSTQWTRAMRKVWLRPSTKTKMMFSRSFLMWFSSKISSKCSLIMMKLRNLGKKLMSWDKINSKITQNYQASATKTTKMKKMLAPRTNFN